MKRKSPKPPFSNRLSRRIDEKMAVPKDEGLTLAERAKRHARNHPNDTTNGRKA